MDSDCYDNCLSTSCDMDKLGNGSCDPDCNNLDCGWDLGDCAYCSDGCTKDLLTNAISDVACKNLACMYDNNKYGWCAEGCFKEDLTGTSCKSDCNVVACQDYDGNPCFPLCAEGCKPSWRGDGYCDMECNNAACAYDGGDCYCAPGCASEKLLETTCDVNDPCDTAECNYKNGVCGSCSSGCTQLMLGDGNCDSSCNNFLCSYDYMDCGCAPGCTSKYDSISGWTWDPSGSESCMVPACEFNYGTGTADGFLVRQHFLTQIIAMNWSLSTLQEHPNCDSANLITYDAGTYCEKTDPCNNAAGMYCAGMVTSTFTNCKRNNGNKCIICTGVMIMDVCTSAVTECPSGYNSRSAIVQLFESDLPANLICLRSPEVFSPYNYKEFYVDPAAIPSSGAEDGTIGSPFKSLYYAFTKVYATFTKILLVAGDYYYQIDEALTLPLISDKNNPLKQSTYLEFYELWIVGTDSAAQSVIYWQGKLAISPLAYKTYIKNVIFKGDKILRNNCTDSFDFCFYCPIIDISSIIKTDQGDELTLDQYYQIPTNCSAYNDYILFSFNHAAYFEDVTFSGFRQQFSSLISSSSSLNLTNVNFSKVQAKKGGAVITLKCTSGCDNSNFGYITGNVTDLNYGYEHSEEIEVGSFFVCEGFHSVYIKGVIFTYNFVLSYLDSAYPAQLIGITSNTGTTTIVDCEFDTNYVNSLITIDMNKLLYTDFKPNYLDISQAFSQTHFVLENTSFKLIYCSIDFITYLMKRTVHNIYIKNVNVTNVHSGENGIIMINNNGKLKDKETVGGSVVATVNTVTTYIWVPPRTLTIDGLTISGCTSDDSVLKIIKMPMVSISNLSISNIEDGDSSKIYPIIDSFYDNNKYLLIYPNSDKLNDLYCADIVALESLYSITISDIDISSTACYYNYASSGIRISLTTTSTTMTNINIHDIISDFDSGLALAIKGYSESLSIFSLTLNNITNQDSSVVEITNIVDVIIKDPNISSLDSNNLSPFIINNIESLEISNFTFSSLVSQYGNGGCLYISASNAGYMKGNLTSGIFHDCKAEYGLGGGLVIDSPTSTNTQYITLKDIEFNYCTSTDGGAIFISNTIVFVPSETTESSFTNIFVTETLSSQGATISDYHLRGLLEINNLTMTENYAVSAGISGGYTKGEFLLSVTRITVNYGYSAWYVFSFISTNSETSIYFSDVTIYNIEGEIDLADAISLSKIKAEIDGITVKDMGQVMNIDTKAEVTVVNGEFSKISAEFVVAFNGVAFTCVNCDLSSITKTVISADSASSIVLNYTKIHGNTISTSSSALILISSTAKKVNSFSNCEFQSNIAGSNSLFEFTSTFVSITDTIFKSNSALNYMSSGIYIYATVLNLTRCKFSEQNSNQYGGFLYGDGVSTISINSSEFLSGSALKGGAIYVLKSSLTIRDSLFSSNIGSELGGSIYSEDTTVSIFDSVFDNGLSVLGDTIYMDSKQLEINNCTFKKSKTSSTGIAGSVYVIGKNSVIISSSLFENFTDKVSAVITYTASSVDISSSIFRNIHSKSVAPISFFGESTIGNVKITNCEFFNNTSTGSGGAIQVENMGLVMKNTKVDTNSADVDGGGLYIITPICKTCVFNITGTSRITNNKCKNEGGAMKWEDYKPNIDSTVIVENNTAAYGADFASKPSGLKPKSSRRLSADYTITNAAPGQNYTGSLNISLYDTYGNVVVTDSSSFLDIQTINTYPDLALSGSLSFQANQGTFTLTYFVPGGPPDSTQRFIASTSAISNSGAINDNTVYEDSAVIEIELRACVNGEQISTTACTVCKETKFLIEPDYSCLDCPTGAYCPGGDKVLPEAGYWRSSELSKIVYPCPVSNACLGNTTETDYIGGCTDGYTGKMCAACSGGYTRTSKGVCNLCPSNSKNITILIFIVIAMVIACIILVKSSIKSAFTPKARHSIYIKIFTNYLQLMFLTFQFNLEWPSYVLELASSQKEAATMTESVFSVDCFVATHSSDDPTNSYYYKLVLISLAPLIVFLISFLVWLGICFTKETFIYMKRELLLTMIVIFFLIYPNIVKVSFSHFSCTNIDMLGYYLRENFAIKCWDSRHTKYSYIVAIPSIVIWSVGVPTIILIVMSKRKRYLNRDNNRVIFGFIFNGYKSSRFYWEFIIMYRKIIMISIAVFFSTVSVNVQALTIVIIMIISSYIQNYFKPYNSTELNHMEVEALITATLTLYCGLYYLTNSIGEEFKTVLFVLIVVGNAYFVLLWLYWMTMAIFNIIVQVIPSLRYILKKGDAFDEEFYKEDIVVYGSYFDKNEGTRAYTFLNKETMPNVECKLNEINKLYEIILQEEYLKDITKGRDSNAKGFTPFEDTEEIISEMGSEDLNHPKIMKYDPNYLHTLEKQEEGKEEANEFDSHKIVKKFYY